MDDAYHCREILGHVAPNWDAPGADAFFTDLGGSGDALDTTLAARFGRTDPLALAARCLSNLTALFARSSDPSSLVIVN